MHWTHGNMTFKTLWRNSLFTYDVPRDIKILSSFRCILVEAIHSVVIILAVFVD